MSRETKKRIISILMAVALFFGGMQMMDASLSSFFASTDDQAVIILPSSGITVFDVCRAEQTIKQADKSEGAAEPGDYDNQLVLWATLSDNVTICPGYEGRTAQFGSLPSTYSHRILLDYIHLKDGKSPQFS